MMLSLLLMHASCTVMDVSMRVYACLSCAMLLCMQRMLGALCMLQRLIAAVSQRLCSLIPPLSAAAAAAERLSLIHSMGLAV